MSYEFINLSVKNGVGWYRFNRAPRNSVDWDMLYELVPAFHSLLKNEDVSVIVLASAIPGYFSTGADLSTFENIDGGHMKAWVDETHKLANLIRSSEKPVLAAIEGIAVGGGLEMSLHADLRFATSKTQLGQPEINIAFIPPVAGTQGLVRLVGRSQAFKILYGGETLSAEEALSTGLVDFVFSEEQLENEVQRYGEMLAAKPANALAAIRRCLVEGGAVSFSEGLEIEEAEAVALADHPNFREGVKAFLSKRKPNWI